MARRTKKNSRKAKRINKTVPSSHPPRPTNAPTPKSPPTSPPSSPPPPPPVEHTFEENCGTLKALIPFKPVQGYDEFLKLTREQKKQFLERQTVEVHFDERMHQIIEHCRTLFKIHTDPQLRGYFDWAPCRDKTEKMVMLRILAQKAAFILRGDSEAQHFLKENHPEEGADLTLLHLDDYLDCRHYTPLRQRVRITPNLSMNRLNPLVVYSDVDGPRNSEISEALIYEYNDRSFVSKEREPLLAEAVALAEEEENQIKCTCHAQEPIVQCYENPECPCYKANLKLQKLQYPGAKFAGLVEFKTFGGLKLKKSSDIFWRSIGFACSELCSCNGHCTNNPLFLLEKQLFNLEITRNNMMMGFGVRTHSFIPAGTPVMDFVGEFTRYDVENENADYMFQITFNEEVNFWRSVTNLRPWRQRFKKIVEELSEENYFVDPKFYGNIGRTCMHSCTPNCEVLRVLQKSITPAHIRIFVVASEDIYPGSPITIDYGPDYIKEQFGGACLCGTFACLNGKHAEHFKGLDYSELLVYFNEIDKRRLREFMKMRSDAMKWMKAERRKELAVAKKRRSGRISVAEDQEMLFE